MVDKSVSVSLRADVAGFVAGIKTAQASMGKFATEVERSAAKRQALTDLGTTAGKVGLAAAAGVAVAVTAFANFDKGMSAVEAATHESAEGMEALRAAALKAGAETVFSATEAAGGIEALAKAGVRTQDILGGGLSGALDLAAAGSLDVATAADLAATAMNQFGLQGADVPHIADLLAAGAGKAQGEVTDLGMALKQSGLVANQTGLSIEETTGALAAFASQGLIGSDAGTSLKTMLQSLTPTTEKAASAMETYGLEAYDAQGNFVGLEKYAGQLADGLGNMSDEQRNATLKTIFGSDAVRAATVLYDEGAKGIGKWVTAVDDQGYAAETAATKLDNLAGDLEALKGSLETALIGTGEGANGPLRGFVQTLTDVVNAYGNLSDGKKGAVLAIGAVVAAAGGAVFAVSRLVTMLATAKTSMATLSPGGGLSTAMGRIAGVASAAAGVLILVEALNRLQKTTEEAAPGVNSVGVELVTLAQGGVGNITSDFDDLAGSIQRITDKSWDQSVLDATMLPDYATPLGQSLGEAEADIAAIDEAMAGLVASGASKEAAAGIQALAESQGLSAAETKQLIELLPQYKEALAGIEGQALINGKVHKDTTRAAEHYYTQLLPGGGVIDSNKGVTAAIEETKTALEEAADEAGTLAEHLADIMGEAINYDQALADVNSGLNTLTDDLAKHSRSLDRDTAAGLQNRLAIADRVTNITELLTAEAEAGKSTEHMAATLQRERKQLVYAADAAGLNRNATERLLRTYRLTPELIERVVDATESSKVKLDNAAASWNKLGATAQQKRGAFQKARDDFIEVAMEMGKTRKQAEYLADKYLEIPGCIHTRVELDAAQAKRQAVQIRRDLTSFLSAIPFSIMPEGGGGNPDRRARGGAITGGRAGQDSVHALLMPGEHVWTTREVQRAGGHGAMQAMRRMAGGGSVAAQYPTGRSFATSSPKRGDVSNDNRIVINGDVRTNDVASFEREAQRRRRTRAMAGRN